MSVLVLSEAHVREALTWDVCRTAMREALIALTEGQCEQPVQRPVLAPEGAAGLLGLMPSYASGPDPLYGLKAVCLFPANTALGLDSHQGAVLLFNGRTGQLLAVLNASAITELRSPAVTAIATDLLARPEASHLAVLGAGIQGAAHVRALARIRPFRRITVTARDEERCAAVCARLEKQLELPVEPCADAQKAVEWADVVVTATTSTVPVLDRTWVRPGTHINAIGSAVPYTREIDTGTMAASTVFVDHVEAFLAETGDYLFAAAEKAIGPQDVRGSLGEVLTGAIPGRTSEQEITLFDSVGLAVEDLFAARYAYSVALERGFGTSVEY